MTVQEGDVDQGRQNDKRVIADGGPALANQPARDSAPARQDYARELTNTIDKALERRSRSERVIIDGIRQRAELYEKAFVQAKQGVIDAVTKDVAATERLARQDQVLRQADVEVLPPETVGKLAALDARQYVKLHDPQRQTEAALAMAATARLSAGYHAALSAKAPEVSAAVRTAIAASEKPADLSPAPTPVDRPVAPRAQTASEALPSPAMALDPGALERVAANRARDVKTVAEQLGLNGIEQVIAQKPRVRRADEQGTASHHAEERPLQVTRPLPRRDNQVASDEVFTAAKDEAKPILPAEVEDKYLRVGTKFYHPKNTKIVAFEDKGNKLQTQSNSEQIAEAMVSIARARGWDEIKVSGSETFRREVWLEASTHGMHVKGYTPSEVDKAELAKRTRHVEDNQVAADRTARPREHRSDAAQTSRVEAPSDQPKEAGAAGNRQPAIEDRQRAQAFAQKLAEDAVMDHPELAGAYAAMAAMKKKADADGLSPQQRAVVMARVEANLVNSIERGDLPIVKVREQVEVHYQRNAEQKVTR